MEAAREIEGICPNCPHYAICKTPCRPVHLFLKHNNLTVHEKSFETRAGEMVTIVYSRSREAPESLLQSGYKEVNKVQEVFSTEKGSPFASFEPSLKQTGVFIDRFFNGWSYKDLAEKYEISTEQASKYYYQAIQRIYQLLDKLDNPQENRNLDYWTKKLEKTTGHLPLGQRFFLLHKLLGLTPSEIAEQEGKKRSVVRELIVRVSDQLKTGELRLIEATPEETEAAKARLESVREKDRRRHARKKASPF